MTETTETEDTRNAARIESERQAHELWTGLLKVITLLHILLAGYDFLLGNPDRAIGALTTALILMAIAYWAGRRSDSPVAADS